MIAAIYIEKFEDLIDEPQTINLGGKYLYTFEKQDDDTIIVTRKINEQYVEDFFNISDSECKVDLVSAIVGENGVGKSTILYLLRNNFIEDAVENIRFLFLYENNDNLSVRLNDNIYDYQVFLMDNKKKIGLENYNQYDEDIFYSPHYDLKYEISDYYTHTINPSDLSLDKYLYEDLSYSYNEIMIGNHVDTDFYQQLLFRNTTRQVKFVLSNIYKTNPIYQKVLNLSKYQKFKFSFIRKNIEKESYSTPNLFLAIFSSIEQKIRAESSSFSNIIIKNIVNLIKHHISQYEAYKDKAVVNGWEYPNTLTAKEEFLFFIKNAGIDIGNNIKKIFDFTIVENFLIKLESLSANKYEDDAVELNIEEYKDLEIIFSLEKQFLEMLSEYYTPNMKEDENAYLPLDNLLSFEPSDKKLSSGQMAFLNLFSKLYDYLLKNNTSYNNIVLLLDEADLGFHPSWKKKYVKILLETIPHFFPKETKLQIIFTTHDPLTLSDMPNNNVVFLKKNEKGKTIVLNNEDKARPRKTFGANITDILSNAFFVEDGLIGDFAKHKIEEVIKWINEQKKDKSKNFDSELAHNKKVVALIDEPVIRRKLTEMITDLAPDNNYYNDAIEAQIKYLQSLKK